MPPSTSGDIAGYFALHIFERNLAGVPTAVFRAEAGSLRDSLTRGATDVFMGHGGEERVVKELGSGTLFGEMALLGGERRSASIRTATASTRVRIPRAALLPLLKSHAPLRQGVWRTFASRRFDEKRKTVATLWHHKVRCCMEAAGIVRTGGGSAGGRHGSFSLRATVAGEQLFARARQEARLAPTCPKRGLSSGESPPWPRDEFNHMVPGRC